MTYQIQKTKSLFAGKYAGIDEYWSLFSVDKKCKEKISLEFEFRKGIGYIPSQYQNPFASVCSSYWNTYLLINAVGIFDNENKNCYGHLGNKHNSKFVVSKIINIKLMKK